MNTTRPGAFQDVRARYFAVAWLVMPFYTPGLGYLTSHFDEEWAWYWRDIGAGYYMYLLTGIAALVTLAGARALPLKQCFGRPPTRVEVSGGLKLTIFLIFASMACAYALFYPLSFFFPDFVTWWFIELPPFIYFDGETFPLLPNLLMLLFICGVAPFFEEFMFRGILLPRWTHKFGVNKALLGTSALFGIVHTDPIGAVLFSICMGVLYLRTQSLYLTITCHAVNNFLVWLMELAWVIYEGPDHVYTLQDFRDEWGWGVGCGVVAIAWAAWYFRSRRGDVMWRLPVS